MDIIPVLFEPPSYEADLAHCDTIPALENNADCLFMPTRLCAPSAAPMPRPKQPRPRSGRHDAARLSATPAH